MFGKNNKEVDYKKLNEVISFTNKILKMLYVLSIVGIISLSLVLLRETKIMSFILTALSIFSTLFIGIVIMWLFNPLVAKMQKKGVRRIFGTTIVYLVLVAILSLVIGMIIPLLSNQLADFTTTTVPQMIEEVGTWTNNLLDNFSGIKGLDIEAVKSEMVTNLQNYGNEIAQSLPTILVDGVKAFFSGMGTILVGLIIGFYLLISFDGTEAMISFLPKKMQKPTDELLKEVDGSLRGFVEGALLDSTFVFLISTLGLWIIGLESPLLFGLFCGITNVIPYAGPYIGGAPAVIVGFAISPKVGLLALLVVAIIQILEGNFIQPIIMSKTTKLHPVTIMLGLLLFGYFWGIIGMVVATPVMAATKTIFIFYNDKYHFMDFKKEYVEEDK